MTDSPLTQPSLLLRIRDPQDGMAWSQFVELYGPVIQSFSRKHGLQEADAADVTQDVLRLVARAVKDLDYDPGRGSFRGWLYTIVRNQVWKSLERTQPCERGMGGTEAQRRLEQKMSPEIDSTAVWAAECERQLFACAAAQVRGDFEERTWKAFWLTGVDGKTAKEVASELGMTLAAVYLAKSRVMKRLKEQIQVLQGD